MEYHNPTLRVLRILELIDANSGGLSLSEIANLLDLPKGTISPILKTLAATNYDTSYKWIIHTDDCKINGIILCK